MARILVVDDHAHVRSAVRRALTRGGHEVWDVANGAEALELLGLVEFDLVLTDVYVTGVGGTELLARAGAPGAVATLVKPFSTHDLRQVFGDVLQRPQAAA